MRAGGGWPVAVACGGLAVAGSLREMAWRVDLQGGETGQDEGCAASWGQAARRACELWLTEQRLESLGGGRGCWAEDGARDGPWRRLLWVQARASWWARACAWLSWASRVRQGRSGSGCGGSWGGSASEQGGAGGRLGQACAVVEGRREERRGRGLGGPGGAEVGELGIGGRERACTGLGRWAVVAMGSDGASLRAERGRGRGVAVPAEDRCGRMKMS
jgi:hypothetical protein